MQTSADLGLSHCNQCGECCRQSSCHLSEQDTSKIAQHLGLSRREFARQYLTVIPTAAGAVAIKPRMTPQGCVFLKDSKCSIQAVKPKGGREFECWTPQPHASRYWWPSDRLKRIGVAIES